MTVEECKVIDSLAKKVKDDHKRHFLNLQSKLYRNPNVRELSSLWPELLFKVVYQNGRTAVITTVYDKQWGDLEDGFPIKRDFSIPGVKPAQDPLPGNEQFKMLTPKPDLPPPMYHADLTKPGSDRLVELKKK